MHWRHRLRGCWTMPLITRQTQERIDRRGYRRVSTHTTAELQDTIVEASTQGTLTVCTQTRIVFTGKSNWSHKAKYIPVTRLIIQII